MARSDLGLLVWFCLLSPCAAQNTGVTVTNGVDGYLEVPYSPAVVPQSGITVEAWITYDDATLPTGWRYPTVVRQGLAAGAESFFLRINADNTGARVLRWKVVTAAGAMLVNWPFAVGQLNTWTHVAGTYDGAMARLLVNGVQVGAVAGNGAPIWDRGDVLRIGKGSDIGGPIEVWHGQLDEVRLWPFARSAGEIAATMNLELTQVPGRVATWNLNNSAQDSSGSLHATASGAVAFTANTLNLTPLVLPPAIPAGTGTPGCLGNLAITVGSVARPGNLEFAPACTRAAVGAAGFLLASLQPLSTPVTTAGVQVWVDPTTSVLTLATVDGLGAARLRLPIPGFVPSGTGLAFQYGFVDPCGPAGITASDAMVVVVQP